MVVRRAIRVYREAPQKLSTTSRRVAVTTVSTLVGSAAGAMLPFLISLNYPDRGQTDAYFVATSTVMFVVTLFTVVMKGIVVPFAAEWLAEDPKALRRNLHRVSLQLGALSILGTLIMFATLLLLPTLGSGQQRTETLSYVLYLSPLAPVMTWCAVNSAGHYALDSYAFPSWSEAFRSVAAISFMLLFGDQMGLAAVPAGLLAGEAVRLVALERGLWSRTGRVKATRTAEPPWMRAFWLVVLPQMASMILVNMNPLIDRWIAAGLGDGAVTLLELADKVFFAPMVLLATSFGVVFGTKWSRWWLNGRSPESLIEDFFGVQKRLGAASAAIAVTIIGLLIVFQDTLRQLVGAQHDAVLPTFIVLISGLPAALAASLGARLMMALKRTRVLLLFAAAALGANILMDLIGAHYFGIVGIALASSTVRLLSAALYLLAAQRAVRAAWRSTSVNVQPQNQIVPT